MDKVLILDGDEKDLKTWKSALDNIHQFETVISMDGKEAVSIMETMKISVLVTDINPPGMDALDILSFMSNKRPNTPCIVMSEAWGTRFKEHMAGQSFLYHLEKPVDTGRLASAVFTALNLRDEGENFTGMTMTGVLPLVEMLKKTCRMEAQVRDGSLKGYLYFNKGVLVDAHLNELRGTAASSEMAKWRNIVLHFSELPRWRARMRAEITPASPSPPPMVEKATLSGLFDKYLDHFTTIIGYKGIAVMGADGTILADHQQDDSVKAPLLASEMNGLFSHVGEASAKAGLGRAKSFLLQTPNEMVMFSHSQTQQGRPFYVMSVTAVNGNWIVMKMNMERLVYEMEGAQGE